MGREVLILLMSISAICWGLPTGTDQNDSAPLEIANGSSSLYQNLSTQVELASINLVAVDMMLDALDDAVAGEQDSVKIPGDIDPEERTIPLEDALNRVEDFLTEQMDTAQQLLSQIKDICDEIDFLQNSEFAEYWKGVLEGKGFNFSDSEEFPKLQDEMSKILENFTAASEDLYDIRSARFVPDNDFDDFDYLSVDREDGEVSKLENGGLAEESNRFPADKVFHTYGQDEGSSDVVHDELDDLFSNKEPDTTVQTTTTDFFDSDAWNNVIKNDSLYGLRFPVFDPSDFNPYIPNTYDEDDDSDDDDDDDTIYEETTYYSPASGSMIWLLVIPAVILKISFYVFLWRCRYKYRARRIVYRQVIRQRSIARQPIFVPASTTGPPRGPTNYPIPMPPPPPRENGLPSYAEVAPKDHAPPKYESCVRENENEAQIQTDDTPPPDYTAEPPQTTTSDEAPLVQCAQ